MKSGTTLAYAALITATVGWSLTPIFLRLLVDTFDPWSVSVIRYGAAFLPALAVSLVWYREDLLRLVKDPAAVLLLGLLTTFLQYAWTAGTYQSNATTAQLVTQSSVIFTIFFAYILFREERAVIRRPLFILGTLLSLGGVAAVLAKQPGSFAPIVDSATLLLLGSAVLWAIYTVWSKHLVASVEPIPLFAAMAGVVTVLCAILAVFFGTRPDYAAITTATWAITIVSGVIPLALGHPCYNFAQHRLGASYCSAFVLLTPLGTFAASAVILPGESLLPAQITGGALLLGGTIAATIAEVSSSPVSEPSMNAEEVLQIDEHVHIK